MKLKKNIIACRLSDIELKSFETILKNKNLTKSEGIRYIIEKVFNLEKK